MVSLLISALLLFVPAGAWALASTAVLTEYAERRARIDVRAMRPTRGRVAPYFAVTLTPIAFGVLLWYLLGHRERFRTALRRGRAAREFARHRLRGDRVHHACRPGVDCAGPSRRDGGAGVRPGPAFDCRAYDRSGLRPRARVPAARQHRVDRQRNSLVTARGC